MRKAIITLIVLIIAVGSYLIFMKTNTITFSDALSNAMEENNEIQGEEVIRSIDITRRHTANDGDSQGHEYIKIEEEETINEIMEHTNDMRLNRNNENPEVCYFMSINTNHSSYDLIIGLDDYIWINDRSYQVEGENKLLEIVSSFDYE
ncbi:hypothetical protein M3202_10390 [Alkalihalobacillus oceani]|uniref:Uncharacterized protein n=1 Tax=Halalkalibacter oceani TaxID=1653776 RepID=A0A9X2DPV4_9BACI|nr:hypothetical protein [Halalkalibacter oceani]MCM3714496.1 hypothetical protein [Halalkalibacter oceani]